MTKAIATTYSTIHIYRRHITLALLALSAIFAFVYAASLFRVISNTTALKQVSSKIAMIDAEVSKLDARYISLTSVITPDSIASHGFSNGKVSAFISRTASLGRVAMAGHEL